MLSVPVNLEDVQPGQRLCQRGFVQRVLRVDRRPFMSAEWICLELDLPEGESWLHAGWSHSLWGAPEQTVSVLIGASDVV